MGPGHNILSACNKTENVHFLCLQLVRFPNPHYVVSWRICRACSQLCSFPIALLPSAADCNKTRSPPTQLGHMIELPHVSHLHFQTDCMLSHKISSTQLYSISSYRGADLWVQSCTQPCCLIAFLLQDWIQYVLHRFHHFCVYFGQLNTLNFEDDHWFLAHRRIHLTKLHIFICYLDWST